MATASGSHANLGKAAVAGPALHGEAAGPPPPATLLGEAVAAAAAAAFEGEAPSRAKGPLWSVRWRSAGVGPAGPGPCSRRWSCRGVAPAEEGGQSHARAGQRRVCMRGARGGAGGKVGRVG